MKKTALITGASTGIGEAIAQAIAPSFHVLLVGRNREKLSAVAAALPSAEVLVADLTSADDISELAAGISSLDALVHSAGVLHMGTVAELTVAQWRESLETNLLAPVLLTQAVLPQLRERAGHVVMINSGLGHRSIAGSGAYSASKFGMRAFADSLRLEEQPHGIRVTSIHPGRVDTGMQERLHAWEGRSYEGAQWIQPGQVAEAVMTALNLGANAAIDSLDITPTWKG